LEQEEINKTRYSKGLSELKRGVICTWLSQAEARLTGELGADEIAQETPYENTNKEKHTSKRLGAVQPTSSEDR
jgi:hypothetical protein